MDGEKKQREEGRPCLFFIYLMAALFVSTAFGIVSTLTMLGFSVVQYLAVRRVTHEPATDNSVSRVGLFVVLAWTFSLLGGIAPFTVMLIFARRLDRLEGTANVTRQTPVL